MNSICVISQRYPCEATPTVHVFVQKFVWALADEGIEVHVISPVPVWSRAAWQMKEKYEEYTPQHNKVTIYRPRFFYAGERSLAGIRMSRLSAMTMTGICSRVIKKYGILPDAFYGHFICVAGICACRLGNEFHRPAFIAYGESTDWSIRNFGVERIKSEVKDCAGFVAVSGNNGKRLIDSGIAASERIGVFPNGVDTQKFYKIDKIQARKKFGLPSDDFIVSYVGQFSERKGIIRLMEAVRLCSNVKVICAGSGSEKPEGEQLLYCGRVKPDDIPWFLSASDLFVLPTQNEGCSNAILEAIACGIPVISSDRPFNYDILDSSYAIMIDPDRVEEIADAIKSLQKDEAQRQAMSECALQKISQFTLKERARKISAWIDERSQFVSSEKKLL